MQIYLQNQVAAHYMLGPPLHLLTHKNVVFDHGVFSAGAVLSVCGWSRESSTLERFLEYLGMLIGMNGS